LTTSLISFSLLNLNFSGIAESSNVLNPKRIRCFDIAIRSEP
jgi:hypothetical protein